MSRSLLLLPLLLAACAGSPGTDTDTDAACASEISTTIPTSGALDADYRAAIEFNLTDGDTTATVTSDIQGTTSMNDKGDRIVFTPTDPLAPSTEYTVTLNYCRGESDLTFTTSSDGTPLDDVSILVGRTYSVALSEGRIVEPAGIGALLKGFLTQEILIGVQTVSDTDIQMIGAIAAEGATPPEQDYCTPSIPFPEADFSEQPYFAIGPETTTLVVSGTEVVIGDLLITGTFASDGSYFAGGTLTGLIDTRPLAATMGDVCELAALAGAGCVACPVDGEPFCLGLVADQIEALQVEDMEPIVAVSEGDCPGCETAPPEPDAVCPDPV